MAQGYVKSPWTQTFEQEVESGHSKRVRESPVRKVVAYSSSTEEELDKTPEIEYGNTTVVLSSDKEEPPEMEGIVTQEEFSLTASGERVVVLVEESDESQASQGSTEAVEQRAGDTIQGEDRGEVVAQVGGDKRLAIEAQLARIVALIPRPRSRSRSRSRSATIILGEMEGEEEIEDGEVGGGRLDRVTQEEMEGGEQTVTNSETSLGDGGSPTGAALL